MNDNEIQSNWLGLNSYTEEDQSRFFGRDKEIDQLQTLIHDNPICTVYGPSGVGKTSLLLAGVFPLLRSKGYLPVYIRLDHSLQAQPYSTQIKKSFLQAAQDARLTVHEVCQALSQSSQETLWEWFHRHEFLNLFKKKINPFILIDQFEEIFTLGLKKAETEGCFDELSDLCANTIPEELIKSLLKNNESFRFVTTEQIWRVVLCLREDFLPRLEEYSDKLPIFRKNRISVSPLNKSQALEVVLKAGQKVLNETVAQAIVDSVIGTSGMIDTPLLSLFCSQLDILRQKNNLKEISLDFVYNNRNDILIRFYDETMGILSEYKRYELEEKLLNTNGYRNFLQKDEALSKIISSEELDFLIQKRLLHEINRDNVQWIELSHDILAPVAKESRERRKSTNRIKDQRQHIIEITESLHNIIGNVDEFIRQYKNNLKIWQDNLKIWQDRAHANVNTLITFINFKKNDFDIEPEKRYNSVCNYYEDAIKILQECHISDSKLAELLIQYTKWVGEIDYKKASKNANLTIEIIKRLQEKNPDTPMIYSAQSLENLAKLHADQNHLEEAEHKYNDVLNIYYHLAKSNTNNYDSDIANTLNNLAKLHTNLNRFNEAEGEYNDALTRYRHLATNNPERYNSAVANTLNNLAKLHSKLNRIPEAEQEYSEALSLLRRLAKISPYGQYDSDLADTLNNIGLLHAENNRKSEAEREYIDALFILRRLAESDPSRYNFNLADTLNNLGVLYSCLNRNTEAARQYANALPILYHLSASNPDRYDSNLANILKNVAILYTNTNRLTDAEHKYKEAIKIYRRLARKQPDLYYATLAETLYAYAIHNKNYGHNEEAEEFFKEALTIYNFLTSSNPTYYDSNIALIKFNLATLHAKSRPNDAEIEFSDALSIFQRLAELAPDKYNSYIAKTLNNLAFLHANLRPNEAEREFNDALFIYRHLVETSPEKYNSYVGKTLINLGTLQLNLNNLYKAKTFYTEAIQIFRNLVESQQEIFKTDLADALNMMAMLYEKSNNTIKAQQLRDEVAYINNSIV